MAAKDTTPVQPATTTPVQPATTTPVQPATTTPVQPATVEAEQEADTYLDDSLLILDTSIEVAQKYAGKALLYTAGAAALTAAAKYLLKK